MADAARRLTLEALERAGVPEAAWLRGGPTTASTADLHARRLYELATVLIDQPDESSGGALARALRLAELVDLASALSGWCATPFDAWAPEEERDAVDAIAEDFVAVALATARAGVPIGRVRRMFADAVGAVARLARHGSRDSHRVEAVYTRLE